MKKKLKIIHILHHRPNPIIRKFKTPTDLIRENISSFEYIEISKYPYWVGFFRGDHHEISASETLKQTKKYNIECWRPYGQNIDKIYSKEVDGIIHRVFPVKTLKVPYLGSMLWSNDILDELKSEIKKNKIIIHLHDGHSRFFTWLVLKLKKIKVPIIYQHRSSSFSLFRYRAMPKVKKYNLTPLFHYYFQLKALRYISHYFSGSLVEERFMIEKLKKKNVSFLMDGIDFDFLKPAKNKNLIKSELGLSSDKIYILYVGRFYRDKNVDKIIQFYKKNKSKYKNLRLLLVGGYKSDEFYQYGKDAGAIMVERTNRDVLQKYYQAANIYLMPTFSYQVINFGGFGTAPIEALACGLPIITNNIIHFPGNRIERDKIGMAMETESKLEENLEYMLNNPYKFKECREITKKYFDINVTNKILRDKYDELFEKYYGDE